MKICILTHTYPPGESATNLYIEGVVNELRKLGLEIVVVTNLSYKYMPVVESKKNLTIYRIPSYSPHMYVDNFEFMVKIIPILKKIYEKEKFDILHSEHIYPTPYAGIFSKKMGIPHIVTVEGMSQISAYSKLLFNFYKLTLPNVHFDLLVSWSRFMINEYLRRWDINEKKMIVVPGSIDTNKLNPKVDGSRIRGKLSDGKSLIMMIRPMYFTNVVGMAYAIKAMKYVVEEVRDCKMIVGGRGRKASFLRNLVNRLSLNKFIEFIGEVPHKDIANYYRAADVIVNSLAYKHAGSITVLESLASGRPNVLSRIECLPGENNIPSNNICATTNPRDDIDIANKIIDVIQDKRYGEKIGKAAWDLVKNNFSHEIIAKRYKVIYKNFIGG